MNLIEIASKLKSFTDSQLLQAMQQPSGTVPSYLVMAELNRRKEARPANPPRTTVMQDLAAQLPQQIPMGQMPGPTYDHGGGVSGGHSSGIRRLEQSYARGGRVNFNWNPMPKIPKMEKVRGIGSLFKNFAEGGVVGYDEYGMPMYDGGGGQTPDRRYDARRGWYTMTPSGPEFEDRSRDLGIPSAPAGPAPLRAPQAAPPLPANPKGFFGVPGETSDPANVRVGQMRQLPAEQYDPWPTGAAPTDTQDEAFRFNQSMRALQDTVPGLKPGAPSSTGAAAPAGTSWHWQQNNPGNIRMTDSSLRSYPGAKPGVKGFLAFETPEQGQAAIGQTWRHISKTYKATTPREIISRYAPRGDGKNDPDAYAASLQKLTGLDPDQPVDLNDPAVMQKIQAAVSQIETGTAGPSSGKRPASMAEREAPGKRDNPYAAVEARLAEIEAARKGRKGEAMNMALINAGLGLMANKSPYFGVALGEAGLGALKGYREDTKNLREDEMLHLSAQAKMAEAKVAYDRGEFQKAFELMKESGVNRRHAETLTATKGEASIGRAMALKMFEHGLGQGDKARDAEQRLRRELLDPVKADTFRQQVASALRKPPNQVTQVDIDRAIREQTGVGARNEAPPPAGPSTTTRTGGRVVNGIYYPPGTTPPQ